jgi:hypothetical protein
LWARLANRQAIPTSVLAVQAFLEEERTDDSEQGCTLDEGRSDDHRRTDIANHFWLACDGFHSAAANLADADACAQYGEACAYSC